MLIADYLKYADLSRAEFATKLGVHVETVRLWIEGQRTPRPGKIKLIGKITGGKVTPADCMAPAMSRAA